MNYLFLSVALFFSVFAHAQFVTNVYWTQQTKMTAAEVIYYSTDKLLQWKDFKGNPDAADKASAITASGFGYKADVKNKGEKGQLNVAVYCYFNKENSWVKPGKTSDYILSHEQHHFNISFIAANDFFEKLKSTNFTNSNYNILLPRLYNESCDLMNKLQEDYDAQTRNGQLKEIQAKWDEYLNKKIITLTR